MANKDPQNISAQNEQSHALLVAGMLGSQVNKLITDLIRKGEEVAAGPLALLQTSIAIFSAKYGEDNAIEKMCDEFPRLDTTYESGANTYTEIYRGEKPNDAGEMKTRDLNFFTEMWESMDEGKAQAFILRQIKLASSGATAAKAEQAFRDMTPDQLDNKKKRITNAKTKGRGYLRRMVGVLFTMVDLSKYTFTVDKVTKPVVELKYADDWETNTFPLDLIDNTRIRKYRPMTIADVLKLDVQAAIAECSANKETKLYDVLEKQLARGSKTGTGKVPALNTLELWTEGAFKLAAGIDSQSQAGKDLVTAITKRMGQKKGGEQVIRHVGELRLALNELWSDAMQVRFDRMLSDEIENSGDTVDDTGETKAAA